MAAVVVMAALFFSGVWIGGRGRKPGGTVRDTVRVTFVDTVKFFKPVPRDSMVVRYLTVTKVVNVSDTDTVRVEVELPVTQKVYGDSSYRAYVSGYGACLDSIFVFPKREVLTILERQKRKRWGIGISAGYGISFANRMRLAPYVGLSVYYNLLNF